MDESGHRARYWKAWDRLTRVLSLRDHSRTELRTKLRDREFTPDIIDRVIADAENQGLIASEADLASRQREVLDRRLKSRRFIEEQLRRKHLPVPPRDELSEVIELSKMRELVARKYGPPHQLSFEDRQRAFRFLKYRGFEDRFIQRVLTHEEF